MPNEVFRSTLDRTRASLARAAGPSPSDGELLDRYVAVRDGDAFAALVFRHGPMVYGVCRRMLADHHLAEDAFQATFVVLARRADAVRPSGVVRNWLYGVAYRTALEARTAARRRAYRERPVAEAPEPVATEPATADADLRAVLDEELARLPDKFRALVVACDLEGRPRREVATAHGLVEGTLSSRLTAGRKMLANRLRRRGLAPSLAAVLAAAREAQAIVPREVREAAARIGRSDVGTVPTAAALATRVSRAMTISKWKLVAAGVLFAAGLAGFFGVAGAGPRDDPPARKSDPAKPAAAAPGPGKLLVWRDTKYVFLDPDGKETGALPGSVAGERHKLILIDPQTSPDGQRVAFRVIEDPAADEHGGPRHSVLVRAASGEGDGTRVALNAGSIAWMPDGKLLVCEFISAADLKDRGFATWTVDPPTGDKKPLDLPKWTQVFAPMPGGKSFAAAVYDLEARAVHVAVVALGGKTTKLTEIRNEGPNPRPSPDGTKILFQDYDAAEKPDKDGPRLMRLFVIDVATKKRERLAEVPLNAKIEGYSWSPDGKKVAYTWKQAHPGVPLAVNSENMNDPKLNTETESFLVVADADGRNPKTVTSAKSPQAATITIGAVDWR